jgi:hypothetical protein
MTIRTRERGESGNNAGARLRHLAIGLLFFLSSGPAGLTNVLCIGADGHISLEQAASPCCGDPAAAAPREKTAAAFRPLPFLAREDCGDCVDIPLATASTLATARHPAGAAAVLQLELGLELPGSGVAEFGAGSGWPPSGRMALAGLAPPPRRGASSHLWAVFLRC